MATFYLDLENGNDANDGTSFANRWKTVNSGATAARIAPGDTIRIMASPVPTSIGSATWTGGQITNLGKFVESSTNATPIVITSTAHGYSTGDTVVIRDHTTNTNANGTWKVGTTTTDTFQLLKADGTNSTGNGVGGATGSMRKINNAVVTLASPLTANIAITGNGTTNWTASANVTSTIRTTDYKEGYGCIELAIADAFTTGLAAYFPVSSLNLSSYQQISFRICYLSGAVPGASVFTIRLCSDSAGVTTVNSFNIPVFVVNSWSNGWCAVTLDNGSALGSNINSIAINVATDIGATSFMIDNIIACKAPGSADSLSLTSLIGKNTAGETWYAIQSINDVRVILDNGVWTTPYDSDYTWQLRGYSGTSETVTTYKRQPILSLNNGNIVMAPQDQGTFGNPITYSGGWNRTDMSTQSDYTWISGGNGNGDLIGYAINGQPFNSFERICTIYYSSAVNNWYADRWTFTDCHWNNCSYVAVNMTSATSNVFTNCIFNNNSNDHGAGLRVDAGVNDCRFINCQANNNSYHGFVFTGSGHYMSNFTAKNNGRYGILFWGSTDNNYIENLTTQWNYVAGIGNQTTSYISNYMYNCTINETIEVDTAGSVYAKYKLSSKNQDGGSGYIIYSNLGRAYSETSVRHTASGYSWKLDVLSTNISSDNPFSLEVAKVAVAAGNTVTAKLWFRRTNTGLTMKFVCKGGQIAGVANDVSSSMTAIADTWEEVTITFTPTEAGVVSLTVEAYGGSTYSGYVDDLTVTQV